MKLKVTHHMDAVEHHRIHISEELFVAYTKNFSTSHRVIRGQNDGVAHTNKRDDDRFPNLDYTNGIVYISAEV